ncbi:MAG TPA: tRNA pseudouridine(38-40) synthase TruA [Candidatus Babeliales bacterium]|nr:tRNA pseudouridine(38-40) synthase TruA [Candidatus Babeliales bacterium]
MVTRYRCTIAYDGTDYAGWQRQKHCANTVTQILEDSFEGVFHEKIALTGASRTDSGVHALGQVVTFESALDITPEVIQEAWNNRLPDSVVVREIRKAEEGFHPQRNVEQKTYHYYFFTQQPLPLTTRYGWFYRHNLDIEELESALQEFVGTHDFRSFCTGHDMKTTVRTIDSITVSYEKQFDAYLIEVKGPGFLRYQIRRMVGAALEVASRPNLSVDYLRKILENKNPEHSLPNAPPQGLVLKEIRYKEQ